jgi:uroporphyrinogen-III synthase
MMRPLLILRPVPANQQTALAAIAAGLDAHCTPLFEISAVTWEAPDPSPYTGVMMTSGNAARYAGIALQEYLHLPLFAVGDATAVAAREAGFASVVSGDKDVSRLLAQIATLGKHHILHLCGADLVAADAIGISIDRRVVYAAKSNPPSSGLAALVQQKPVVMLHSPRAAAEFALISDKTRADRSTITLIAISENTAASAGDGWEEVAIAAVPRDDALIELARQYCAAQK